MNVAPDASTAALLRRLELTVSRRLDGLLHGEHEGLRPGHGTEPGDVRAYQPGDDVRRLDWAVTARTGEPHVRPAIAETELETWVVADVSASLAFGTAKCEKRDLALAAAASVSFLTARAGNRIGGVLVTPTGRQTVPARTGGSHARAFLHRLASVPPIDGGGPTDLAGALRDVSRLARRRGLVVVISDFLSPDPWERALRALSGRHEVLAVEVVDQRELDLPDVGLVRFMDPETGHVLTVQTADRRLRARYASAAAVQRGDITRSIRRAGADHVVLRTDRDWLADLVTFVEKRRRRRRQSVAARPSGGVA
jgi:uncharacterized protein (DUF58 family)